VSERDCSFNEVLSFGPFTLYPGERKLEKYGEASPLGSRAFDILMALIEAAGNVIDKRDLMARVWLNTVVDESNLRVNIAALRKILGEGKEGARYISNTSGRGYSFVAQVTRARIVPGRDPLSSGTAQRRCAADSIPTLLTRRLGRDNAVNGITTSLKTRRFVSIVGPGGMGKSTVAIAVSNTLIPYFSKSIHFIDLGSLINAELMLPLLASKLGVFSQGNDPYISILACLQGTRSLLVLDNCEHLIATVAVIVQKLLRHIPGLYILATSREPLSVEGEWVYRLAPLDSPAEGEDLTLAQAKTYSAVQLFIDGVRSSGCVGQLTDDDAPAISEIGRQLGGNPLAIKIAADRVSAFGVKAVAQLLNHRSRLQWRGRRTATTRHQTLSAMLDWSYTLLAPHEQQLFRQLSVFDDSFALDAALTVAPDNTLHQLQCIVIIDNLVAKSLLEALPDSNGVMRYRLCDINRAYAFEKLLEMGEFQSAINRLSKTSNRLSDTVRTGDTALLGSH
jgi:predicted ATPase/DNA-binding winged helix-turn-helix (wHTH) protein